MLHRLLAACLLLAALPALASEAKLGRYPAISPDGTTIAFSYQGDLWRVSSEGGEAVRLTANEAYDAWPVFSPSGRTLAFGSDRYGDFDVFVMPLEGGPPRRLTHADTGERPQAFAPDGRSVYFSSRRLIGFPMGNQIFEVPVEGGTPLRLVDVFADEVATLDGETFIYAEGRFRADRKRYRGSYQREILRWTRGGDPVALTDNRGYDHHPMIGPDGTVYWIGDMDDSKTFNVWAMDPDGGGKRQVTKFKDDGVRWAGIGGGRLVLERGTDLWVMDLPDGRARPLTIHVAADALENPVVIETKSSGVDEVAVADDGDEMALVIDGEIVLVHRDQGGRAAVCAEGPWLDESVSFRPGSADTLLFTTDRYGETAVCLLVSDEEDQPLLRKAKTRRIVKLTDGKRPAGMPQWSPDGQRIAYVSGNGDLRVMNADGGDDGSLSDFWNLESYEWAPDSRWIAFSRSDRNYNSDIWIVPADGGDAVNVTKHPEYDENPVWSPDGRMLAWSTTRHSHDPNTRNYDVYMCYLTRADDERTREEWELWQKTRDDEPAKPEKDEDEAEGDDEEAEEEEPFEIAIDFEDIHLRARRMTSLPGVEWVRAIGPESDLIYFTATIDGDTDLYSIDRFADEREDITSGGADPRSITLDPKGKTFALVKGGKPATLAAGGGKPETVDFSARLTIDRPAARLRVLDEAWRVLRDNFYDPDMHGVDWKKLRTKYAEWVALAAHDRDFSDVVNWMLGELNASHMGYYPSWSSEGEYADDGWLGLEVAPTPRGAGLLIRRAVRNGPCDKVACSLLPGDVLLRVDGRPVGSDDNLWAALENRQDLPTSLLIERDGEELEFETVPVGWFTIYLLNYLEAERDHRAAVEAASDGRVGYVHIRGMGFGEVERFQQNLFAAADGKEALIIDVRNNGGGWTTDLLLTALTQPEHAFTIGRGGEVGYPQVERQPYYRWSGPIAVICNEGSYSNAEIFSHAVKTIGRGPVVGMETGGNVISTGGFGNRYKGYVRLPFRGWWVWGDAVDASRNGKFQEGVHEMQGCIPDYVVDLTPADRLHGRDPQIDKAVELMLQAADDERSKPERRPIGGWDVWSD